MIMTIGIVSCGNGRFMKTAKALGLAMPDKLIALADEIIE
jgi:hypothetical protein